MIEAFHRPVTVEEAVRLKERWAERACFLGGGTQINSSEYPCAPQHLISLEGLALDRIRVTETEWIIGAGCTIQALIESPDIPECLQEAGQQITNRNIRNASTLGGSLGGARSWDVLIPLLVALNAQVDVSSSKGLQTLSAYEHVSQSARPVLITRVRIPRNTPPRAIAFERYVRTANDLPILTTAVALTKDGDRITDPIIALGGVAERVTRLKTIEGELNGSALPVRKQLEQWVANEVSPVGDFRGSADYKRYLAGVVVAAAVEKAFRNEGGQV